MIENLYKNTGKTLDEWVGIVQEQQFSKHNEAIKFLKDSYQMSHGFANLIAHSAKKQTQTSEGGSPDLVEQQYKGKEHWKPLYTALHEQILQLGKDVEVSPKNSYVSYRRKKQFAILNPATKTRFEVGLNLKGQEAGGRLQAEKPNSMCSHKIALSSLEELDEEVMNWIKTAYDKGV